MMIRQFIVETIIKKLTKVRAMVIYDPEQRYADLLPLLAEQTIICDIRQSVLTSWEDAYRTFNAVLPNTDQATLLIYSHFGAPADNQAKIEDPFFIFTQGKNYFPYSASERYDALCKSCFPDKEQKINELFAEAIPNFDTIDALSEGSLFANLQSLTGGKSEKEIITVLMLANQDQEQKLRKDKTWLTEYKQLATQLGFKSVVRTYEQANEELWRIMLFSEFVFDLPVSLPEKLKSVAIAAQTSKPMVLELLKSIRNNKSFEDKYIEMATAVESQLGLSHEFRTEINLGEIVTFSFEDITNFHQFITHIASSNLQSAKLIINKNKDNIWPRYDTDRRALWLLAEFAAEIIEVCQGDFKIPKTSIEIVKLYVDKLYLVDQLHRRYEMALYQLIKQDPMVSQLTELVRRKYRSFVEKWQNAYQESMKNYPIEGLPANINIFDKLIAPQFQNKKKVAYLLIDALRYELGKELESSLAKYFDVQVKAACAYLPTVTEYAMAALLPKAHKLLYLEALEGKLTAIIDGKPLPNLSARRQYLKDTLGDRCEIINLNTLLSGYNQCPDLLVITDNEIDAAGAFSMHTAFTAMQQSITSLVRCIVELKNMGYEKMIIATDHGFMIYPEFEPGDKTTKPYGEWSLIKSRVLIGKGNILDDTLSFEPSCLGIRTKEKQIILLKNYAVYENNLQFFHEGLSLQENIVPIIEINVTKQNEIRPIEVILAYRGKSEGTITTRRPIIDLSCFQEGNIGFDLVTIKVQAFAIEKLIGEPVPGDNVNELTKLVEVGPGRAYKLPFAMDDDFEGKFEIIVSDPLTGKVYAKLSLSTNYMD